MKTHPNITRRHFLETTSFATAGLSWSLPQLASAESSAPSLSVKASPSKPAILGGEKAHPGSWPKWPIFDETEEKHLLEALRSGRGSAITRALSRSPGSRRHMRNVLALSTASPLRVEPAPSTQRWAHWILDQAMR